MPIDTVADWVRVLDERYPEADAASWDTTGLQVGDPGDPVHGVLVCLDVTDATLDEAQRRGADLLVAHHPLLFRPLARLTPETAAGHLALRAARSGIAVAAAHTNLDVAVPGTSHPVAAILGLTDTVPLLPQRGEDVADSGKGLGLVGSLPESRTLADVAGMLAARLPAPLLRVAGDPDRAVNRVAVCGGAGDSLITAAARAGADLFVTGDLRHHVALDALTGGLALIDAGHYATEAAALPALVDTLTGAAQERGLTARVLASEVRTEPWIVPGASSPSSGGAWGSGTAGGAA